MRVNVCVNGTFRYPDYIRGYAEANVLGRFHFAHRLARSAASLGLSDEQVHNVWLKHYPYAAAFRWAVGPLRDPAMERLCDAWQKAVLRHWQPCDSLEVVIGGLVDRVIARAIQDGSAVLGHPVTTHPTSFRRRVDAARADLGLAPEPTRPEVDRRRLAEIAGCDALVVDSQAVARSFAAAGVARRRIHVVHPAFDATRFHPTARDAHSGRFRVVCIGTLTPRKGQQVLLRAWRRLALPNAELILVGAPGRDATAVMAGVSATVTYLGHIDQARLRGLLAEAACLVLPSAEDGFGQVALEAMACGVPVVVSDAVGAADLVEHGRSGFIVPALDAEALAHALEQLYRDRDRVAAMGRHAASAVASLGSWSAYVNRVLDLHRQLAGRGGCTSQGAAA